MKFRKEEPILAEAAPEDPTAWLIDSGFAEFVLMSTPYIKYMCMLGYTYMHGSKVFSSVPEESSLSFKFISMLLACTGGGILVPIFLNSIPVPLSQDVFPIAIMISFLVHEYFPVLRDAMKLSPIFKAAVIVLYEALRASVVVKLTGAAGKAIAPSEFEIAIFGPIFCGTIAGCGGAFLPLNKGLDPIKAAGLGQPMMSALVGATFYHLFVHTSLSDGVMEATKKAQVVIACFFIAYNMYSTFAPVVTAAPKEAPLSEKAADTNRGKTVKAETKKKE